jgi:sec-independent protein translocase protein TatA
MDVFDSPWKILIIAILIIVLFGSRKLPGAARSLGQSMRILKKEMQGLHEDEPAGSASADFQAAPPAEIYPAPVAPAPVAAPAPVTPAPAVATPSAPSAGTAPDAQAQISALQEQLNSLKHAVGANGATATDGQQTR